MLWRQAFQQWVYATQSNRTRCARASQVTYFVNSAEELEGIDVEDMDDDDDGGGNAKVWFGAKGCCTFYVVYNMCMF